MKRDHVDAQRARALARGGTVSAAEALHLAGCRACRGTVEVLEASWLDPTRSLPASPCLDAVTLVRLAEDRVGSLAERRTLHAHVASCAFCAGEIDAVALAARAAGPAPARPGRGEAGGTLVDRLLRLLGAPVMPPSVAVATRARTESLPWFRRAMVEYRGRRYARARSLLLAARKAGEAIPEIGFYLGCCWLRAGNAAEAVTELETAVAQRPRVGDYRFELARALLAAGRSEEAVRHLARAAALPGPHRDAARRAVALARGPRSPAPPGRRGRRSSDDDDEAP